MIFKNNLNKINLSAVLSSQVRNCVFDSPVKTRTKHERKTNKFMFMKLTVLRIF